jgi:hypothetical protein
MIQIKNVDLWDHRKFTVLSLQPHVINQFFSHTQSYPDVTYYLVIARRPWFYIYTVIFPSLLITCTGFYGIFVPCSNEKRISVGLKSFLSQTIFLMMVPETLPPNSDQGIPLIAAYYIISMMLISFGTFFSILTYIHNRDRQSKSSLLGIGDINN